MFVTDSYTLSIEEVISRGIYTPKFKKGRRLTSAEEGFYSPIGSDPNTGFRYEVTTNGAIIVNTEYTTFQDILCLYYTLIMGNDRIWDEIRSSALIAIESFTISNDNKFDPSLLEDPKLVESFGDRENFTGLQNRQAIMVSGLKVSSTDVFGKYFKMHEGNLYISHKAYPIDLVALVFGLLYSRNVNKKLMSNLAVLLDLDTLRAELSHNFSNNRTDNIWERNIWESYSKIIDETSPFDYNDRRESLINVPSILKPGEFPTTLPILELDESIVFWHATPICFKSLQPRSIFGAVNPLWSIDYVKKNKSEHGPFYIFNLIPKKNITVVNLIDTYRQGGIIFKEWMMKQMNGDENQLLEWCNKHNIDGIISVDHASSGHCEIFVKNSEEVFTISNHRTLCESDFDINYNIGLDKEYEKLCRNSRKLGDISF